MLDVKTKQTIDNACDVLVGKVPSPQTQVEIITAALIYKFMDDMDLSGVELSGKRTFFVGDLEPYAFSTIVHTKGNQERMNRYLEGLERVQVARTVPELFRRIFKDTMIPFRDSNTFSLFLKEIAELPYEDSEKLGDAFEYLLNRMGTQGNAGQFRTPRNIIDFIVNVVDPTKDDTILDPACGTAGFLISAYKHITSNKNITPDEFKKITANITGLDIDPTMVKLALVNLYLHKFQKPNVYEYDTLSNDARWDDSYDVILANPPFMTPKGGIVPHKRFAIQANRSEVLFVDYFMEHLTPKGRAGFVVPEGIIFQTANAYKDLRKMMLNGYLYAVVSLPSGVFNPYSGVKTSILFFDRTLAKRNDNVLFVRVDNDGYSLGAQRTPVKQNDLPEALKIINEYREGKDVSAYERAVVVPKKRIIEQNYDLTAAKYVDKEAVNCKYEMVKLGDVAEVIRGISFSKKDQIFDKPSDFNSVLQVVTTKGAQENGIDGDSLYFIPKRLLKNNNQLIKKNDILISIANSLNLVGRVTFVSKQYEGIGFGAFLGNIRSDNNKILPAFLYHLLKSDNAKTYFQNNARTTTNISNLPTSVILEYEIPLPPLETQRRIVDELENKQSTISLAYEIINNLEKERQYFGRLLDGIDYNEIKLGDVAEISSGNSAPQNPDLFENGIYPFCRTSDVGLAHISNKFSDIQDKLNEDGIKGLKLFKKGTILFPKSGASILLNHRVLLAVDSYVSSHLATIYADTTKALPEYLFALLCNVDARDLVPDTGYPSLKCSELEKISIPLPSIDDQTRIVEKLEEEQEIIDVNKRLIDLMQNKINQVIQHIYKCDL